MWHGGGVDAEKLGGERESGRGVMGQMGTNKESGWGARGSVESYVGVSSSERPERSITVMQDLKLVA